LVIYVANGGPAKAGGAGLTGTPTLQTYYSNSAVQGFMDEAFAIATQGLGPNVTDAGAQWSTCLACAVVDRTRARQGYARQGVCNTCFANYCWNGQE